MKNIIKIGIFAFIVLLSQNVFAQDHHRMRGGHELGMIEKFKEHIDLTTEQEAQLQAIQKKYKTQKEELRKGETEDRMAKRAQMQEMGKAMKEEVENVLTEDQLAILKKKREEMREKRKEMHTERRAKMEKNHKEMRTAMERYKTENIEPTVLAQRAKLEATLSEEDKAAIAELRPIFERMKEKGMQKRESFKQSGERPDREKMQEDRKAFHEANKVHFETLKGLVEKYDESITGLFEELEEEKVQWKEDMRKIKEQNRPERVRENGEKREFKERKPRGEKGKYEKGARRHHKGHPGEKFRGPKPHSKKGHFLLMDPNTPADSEIVENANTKIKVFPNPASNATTISYEVETKGKVRIELRDEAGNILKVLEDNFKETGAYKIEVDLSEMQSGVYYYTITDGVGMQSKKIIVSK